MKSKIIIVATIAVLSVTGCGQNANKPIGDGFGDSVRYNMAIQTVNPHRTYSDDKPTGLSGPRAAGAIGRYDKGDVRSLKIESTSKQKSKSN